MGDGHLKLMIDTKSYNSKPSDPWNIGKRIVKNAVDITPERLAAEIIKGKTFVPSFLNKKIDGEVKRRMESWTSQQIIALDFDEGMRIEEALEEFKDSAMFIYTTFSHTEEQHRFRVVFGLDQEVFDYHIISNILKQFEERYQIDGHCKDGVRLFYGGNKLYELNYEHRLKVNHFSTESPRSLVWCGISDYRNNNNHNNYITIVPIVEMNKENIDSIDTPMKKRILDRNVDELRTIMGVGEEEKVFYTMHEIKDYLFRQDLGKFLGIDNPHRHSCYFHFDQSPSAGIIYDEEQGRYIYNCFSSNCTFKTGLIIKCVETILDCDYSEAIEFLMEVFRLRYEETEWQQKQKRKIDFNKQYIQSEEFKIEYPELYMRIKKYIIHLDALMDIARLNMPPEHYTNEQLENLFFVSIRHFANRIGKSSLGQVANEIGLFVYLGLLGKLKKEDIPKELLDRAEEELRKNKERFKSDDVNMVSFFYIPSFSRKTLEFGENKAIEFKEKNFTMRGWSREMLLRGLGEEEADRVYPQMSGRIISKKSYSSASLIENVVLRAIEGKGWVTERYVVNTVIKNYKTGKTYTEKQIKRIMAEMLDKYDIKRERLSGELREKFGISKKDVKGNPNIFYRELRKDI